MTSSRWAAVCAIALLGVAPVVGLAACGSSGSDQNGDDGGGAGDDSTTSDGAGGGDGTGHGDAVGDGGGGDHHVGDGACGVLTCPPTALCGHYTDPCGNTITCGSPCPKGQVCTGTGASQSCQVPSCTGKCGVIGTDSCGVPIGCGGLSHRPDVRQQPVLPHHGERRRRRRRRSGVRRAHVHAQHLDDPVRHHRRRCGDTLSARRCPIGQQCSGGVCGPVASRVRRDRRGPALRQHRQRLRQRLRRVPGCTGNCTCQAGTCVGCAPPSCGSATCGTVSNGCGPSVTCGSCTGSGEKCYDGGCCTPLSCAQAAEAGTFQGCAEVDLGCGVHQSCSTCGSGEKCYDGGCCTPLTCADAVDAGLVAELRAGRSRVRRRPELLDLRHGRDVLRRRLLHAPHLRPGAGRGPRHRLRQRRPRLRRAEELRAVPDGPVVQERPVHQLHAEDVRRLRQRRVRAQRRVHDDAARLLRCGHDVHGHAVLSGRRGRRERHLLPAGPDQRGRHLLSQG